MDIHALAIVLLLAHIVAIGFMATVLRRQWGLFKRRTQPSLIWLKRLLFILSLTVTFGNIISALVDLFTIFDLVERSTNSINTIGLVYSGANTLVALTSALIIWLLYKMASKTLVLVDYDKKVALEKHD